MQQFNIFRVRKACGHSSQYIKDFIRVVGFIQQRVFI